MSELAEIREELDQLRTRITALEFDRDVANGVTGAAITATRAADRTVAKTRTEWREVTSDLEAGIAHIISLLTPEADAPARRPENTQSAKDKPLT
jgi:hypothetical protein